MLGLDRADVTRCGRFKTSDQLVVQIAHMQLSPDTGLHQMIDSDLN
jgi:hypothetical protein